MKKNKNKLIFFLVLLMGPLFVFASEVKNPSDIFTNTNNISLEMSTTAFMPMGNNLRLSDGYIMQGLDETGEVIRRLDLSGNVIWKVETLGLNNTKDYVYLYQLNDTEILVSKRLGGLSKLKIADGTVVVSNENINGGEVSYFNGNYVVATVAKELVTFNEDLEIVSTLSAQDIMDEVFSQEVNPVSETISYRLADVYVENDTLYLLIYSSDYYYYIVSISNDEKKLVVSVPTSTWITDRDAENADFVKVDDYFYVNNDTVYEISLDGTAKALVGSRVQGDTFKSYTELAYDGTYFLLSGLEEIEVTDESEVAPTGGETLPKKFRAIVDVYDKKWNLLETIDLNAIYGYEYVENDDNYYIFSNPLSTAMNVSLIDGGFITTGNVGSEIQFLSEFKIPYDISTTTDANGEIEVISEAFSGDMITFRVSPRTGYKLSTLTVTNEALETIVFTEDDLILNSDGTVSVSVNSFTMPSSDVEIAASFEKIPENPNTIDDIIFYVSMFVVSISLIIGLVIYKKKHK